MPTAPAPASAWGFEPHKYIMARAIALLPRGDPAVLPQVPDHHRRARRRSGPVADRRMGAGAAAALPRHGCLRPVSLPELPERTRRSDQALRPRVRREERAGAVARHRDLPEAGRGVPPAGAVLPRQHQVLLVGADALRLGRARAVSRGAELRRPAHRPVGHPLAVRDRAVRAESRHPARRARSRWVRSATPATSSSTR